VDLLWRVNPKRIVTPMGIQKGIFYKRLTGSVGGPSNKERPLCGDAARRKLRPFNSYRPGPECVWSVFVDSSKRQFLQVGV
jgi:hypothetical protein